MQPSVGRPTMPPWQAHRHPITPHLADRCINRNTEFVSLMQCLSAMSSCEHACSMAARTSVCAMQQSMQLPGIGNAVKLWARRPNMQISGSTCAACHSCCSLLSSMLPNAAPISSLQSPQSQGNATSLTSTPHTKLSNYTCTQWYVPPACKAHASNGGGLWCP